MKISEADVVCFDVDYTLVKYTNTDFIYLQFESLAKMMVKYGAPPELLTLLSKDQLLSYSCSSLIADFKTGFVIKLASDNTIIRAYHGLSQVTDLTEFYGSPPVYNLEEVEKYYIPSQRRIFLTHFSFDTLLVWLASVELIKLNKFHIENYIKLAELIYECCSKTYGSESESFFYPEFYANHQKYVKKTPDSFKEKLVRLKNSGKKLAVVTNGLAQYANLILEYSYGPDWHSMFEAYVFSAGKPDFFFHENELEVIRHLDLEGEAFVKGSSKDLKDRLGGHHYVFVGDHYVSDIHGAKQFEMVTVALIEEIYYEKGINYLCTTQEIEDASYNKPEDDVLVYQNVWGSHFVDNGKRNYWWDYVLGHADYIIPTIESVYDLFDS